MKPAPERPRLRKREILFAVAAGVLASGAAMLMLDDSDGGGGGPPPMAALAGPSEKTYQAANFDEISTVGPQDVVVTLGDTFSVRAEGSPQALAILDATVVNGRLSIKPKDANFNFYRWPGPAKATYYVTLPKLEGVAVAGSGDVTVDRIEGKTFEGSIAGPGTLSIATMNVDDVNFTVGTQFGGSGDVIAAGTARRTHISIGGSGDVKAAGLRSDTASIAIGGSGDVALTVENEAKVSVAGSGDVAVTGPAQCSVTRMGSGEVRCTGGGGTDGDDND